MNHVARPVYKFSPLLCSLVLLVPRPRLPAFPRSFCPLSLYKSPCPSLVGFARLHEVDPNNSFLRRREKYKQQRGISGTCT